MPYVQGLGTLSQSISTIRIAHTLHSLLTGEGQKWLVIAVVVRRDPSACCCATRELGGTLRVASNRVKREWVGSNPATSPCSKRETEVSVSHTTGFIPWALNLPPPPLALDKNHPL
jgi:hypothetical protein